MTPRLTFHGAARAVTGSCFRLETASGQVLIDCGMFQGSKTEKELNYRAFPFPPRGIAAVVLSHAHIDHSGLLPKLVKEGYAGPIHATAATADLAGVMLPDSAHIQAFEVERLNRRKARWRAEPVEPIYSGADAETCLGLFRPEPYDCWFGIVPGVRARFWNAGHMLGSASIEIEIGGAGGKPERPLRLLFSGDIGPGFKLLHPEPEAPDGLDYLICEATYGDRDRIERALRNATFQSLASLESRSGFVEAVPGQARFFRAGTANQWRGVLTRDQVARVVASHREQMRRFGYLPAGY